MKEPDVDQFRVGDVWQTSRGGLFRVISVVRGGVAVLRVGSEGSGGRMIRRRWDDVMNWVRVSSGGMP